MNEINGQELENLTFDNQSNNTLPASKISQQPEPNSIDAFFR